VTIIAKTFGNCCNYNSKDFLVFVVTIIATTFGNSGDYNSKELWVVAIIVTTITKIVYYHGHHNYQKSLLS
jgi:hypothetical protein